MTTKKATTKAPVAKARIAPQPALPVPMISARIERLRNDLRTVNEAIPILGGPAILKAEEIVAELTAANDELATSLANRAAEERKVRLAGFGSIEVSRSYPTGCDGNLLRAVFTITYTKAEYDQRRGSVMKPHSVTGFKALSSEAMEYLQEVQPEAIPAEIMALAPGNPQEAFGHYFMGLRRGSIRT